MRGEQRDSRILTAAVTGHAHRLDREKHANGLAGLVLPASRLTAR